MLSKVRRFSILQRSMTFYVVIVSLLGSVVAVGVVAGHAQQRHERAVSTRAATAQLATQVKQDISALSEDNSAWLLDATLGHKVAPTQASRDAATLQQETARLNQ